MAEILSVSQNAIHNWESGKREPSIETVKTIADKLNIDVWYLIEDSSYLSTPDGFDRDEYREKMHFINRMEKFCDELNALGQEKAIEYTADLTKIPEYQKEDE